MPSGRSLAIGFGLIALAAGAYVIARETSIFAVQRIEVEGAPPALAAQIRTALGPLQGGSLVSFSSSAANRRLAGLPQIARVSYDRDFPHTLKVTVTVEQPVAVLRKAAQAWLVSASGRVLQELRPGTYPPLPRIWLAAETDVTVGAPIETGDAIRVATALRGAHFPAHVLSVQDDGGGRLVIELAGGREVRLGGLSNLAVKLAVAAAIVPQSTGASYIDVSVPTRAVAGYSNGSSDSQVSGQG
ncbi:MAG TPA: FtsQ-type POTRA domain-containing protein [Gaiellaceae bacterium]|nr:FtsQ-type POTRA domain-containing protein [Gaiellaceae bacterium]